MALKSETLELQVGEETHTFTVNQLSATRAEEVLTILNGLLGAGVAKLGSPEDLGPAVGELLQKLGAKELSDLRRRLLIDAGTVMDGAPFKKETFDGVFAGQLLASYKLLGFAIRLNFADFGGGLSALVAVAKAKLSSLGVLNTFSGQSTVSSSKLPDTETSGTGKLDSP